MTAAQALIIKEKIESGDKRLVSLANRVKASVHRIMKTDKLTDSEKIAKIKQHSDVMDKLIKERHFLRVQARKLAAANIIA